MQIVGQLFIRRVLAAQVHEVVKLLHQRGHASAVFAADVCDRRAEKIAALERHDLVCVVHNRVVLDIRPDLFDAIIDRLNTAHIAKQEILFGGVHVMLPQHARDGISDISRRDALKIRNDFSPPGVLLHGLALLPILVSS